MLAKTIKYLVQVQIIGIVGLIACVIIRPHGLQANAGLSYFGNYKTTILPYAIVLLGGAWYFYKASLSLPKDGYNLSRAAFTAYSILYVGIFITPYTLNNAVDWMHKIIGITIFASQLLLTGFFVVRSGFNKFLAGAWAVEFIAGLLCAIYTPPPTGYLLESQVLFQIVFTIFYAKYLSIGKSFHKFSETLSSPTLQHK